MNSEELRILRNMIREELERALLRPEQSLTLAAEREKREQENAEATRISTAYRD